MRITPRRARWIGCAGALLLRGLGASWRIRMYGHSLDLRAPNHLVAFLHGDMLVPAVLWRRYPAAIMISQHGDGELIAQVVLRLGRHLPIRGSSTRGGARAFLEIVKHQGDIPWAITPDGPRGPRGHVHEGVIQLAAEGGRAVVPAGFAVAFGKRFRSWDRFVIPGPLARVAGWLGESLPVPAELDSAERSRLAAELARRLQAAEVNAQRALAAW